MFRISIPDLKLVRNYCEARGKEQNYSCRRFVIFVGERYNTANRDINPSINIALLTKDPDWSDTDLWDNSHPWSVLRRPIPVSDEGEAWFDFWIYERGGRDEGHGELLCNAQAFFKNGKLVRLEADGDKIEEIVHDTLHC